MPHECTGCGHVFPDGSKEMLSGCPDCGGNKFQFRPSSETDGSHPTADADPDPPDPPTEGSSMADAVAGATERVRDFVGRDDEPDEGGVGPADDGADDHEWPAVGREGADGSAAARSAGSGAGGSEDTAQASARTSVVEPDELPDPSDDDGLGGDPEPAVDAGTTDRPAGADASSTASGNAPSAAADPEPTGDGEADAGDVDSPFTGSGDRDDGPGLSDLRAELNDQFESIRIVDRGQYELNLMELYDRDEYIISLLEDGRYAIEVPEAWRDE